MSASGQSRHFDRAPMTSDLPQLTDLFSVGREGDQPLTDAQ
jgi:hypothetical protein